MSDLRKPPDDPFWSSSSPTVLPSTDHRGRRKASSIVLPVLFALALVLVGFTGMWAWMRWGTGGDQTPAAVNTPSSTPSPTPPTTSATPTPTPSGSATHTATTSPTPTPTHTHSHHATASPEPVRTAPVVVFNQTGVSGLAATFAGKLTQKGWHVTAVDNWVGTVPSSTVYYRPGGEAAARTLQHDFPVIGRLRPAVTGMPTSGLTVILAGNVHL